MGYIIGRKREKNEDLKFRADERTRPPQRFLRVWYFPGEKSRHQGPSGGKSPELSSNLLTVKYLRGGGSPPEKTTTLGKFC